MWPTTPPKWLIPWVNWKINGGERPTAPKKIPLWAFEFLEWANWLHKGKIPPRPSDLPHVIPKWAWGLYPLINFPKPPVPPTPPPQPPKSKWLNPPYIGRGVHFAWGFVDGFNDGSYGPDDMAKRLKDHNYKWGSLEVTNDNRPFHAPFKIALHNLGLYYGIWERTDQMNYSDVHNSVSTYQPDFYLADIETFPVQDPSVPDNFQKDFPNLPRAVFIAGMPNASYCEPWINNYFDCMTQAYTGPNPQQTALNMDSDAYWRGWPRNAINTPSWAGHDDGPHTYPSLEINAEGSKSLKDQLVDVADFNGNYSVYCAELFNPDDWNS